MLRGVDISNWQDNSAVDLGADFVICKATEGTGYVDPTCDAKYQAAKAQGKLLGVYHFARPDYNDAVAEADYFVDNIQGYIGEAILVLDWEVATSNVAWAKTWLDRVYERTGVKPLIYMSASVIAANDWSSVAGADYGLWIAGYPNAYNVANPPEPAEGEMPYSIGPWSAWAIWQYSSSAGTLDRNVANMDRDGWMRYAAKNGEAKPAPIPAPTPEPAPAPTPTTIRYTVAWGDTLTDLAKRFGTTVDKLVADNGIADADTIYAGQVITINLGGAAAATGLGVGSRVTLKDWVDYNGTPLTQTRPYYFIQEVNGDRAVLAADYTRGTVYAAVNTNNLRSA